MRTALVIVLTSAALLGAEPQPGPEPVEMRVAVRQAEENWRAVLPDLFSAEGQKHIGAEVRCSGSPLSLQSPVSFKVAGDITVRLTKLQGADREELAKFRKPPSVVTVWGPILAIDRSTRTVTIKAVSTMFAP